VAAVIWVLDRAGGGQLAAPPLTDPASWARWASERDPVVAALAIVRALAVGAVWYLLVATVVGGVLRLLRAGRLVTVADRLTVPALRRVLVATAGVTLAAGVNPTLALAGSAQPDATSVTTTTVGGSRPPPTLTMRVLGPDGLAATVAPSVERPPPAAAGGAAGGAGAAAAGGAGAGAGATARAVAEPSWTVRPGECFWSIADDVLARAWGRVPSDAEIVPYWRSLIEANRHLLGDRTNEDLIYPGQVFTVPTPPASGA
jgi:nucleoid-associated protein YgaU